MAPTGDLGCPSSPHIRVIPARWAFHCRNLYHMMTGMMTEFRYLGSPSEIFGHALHACRDPEKLK